MTYCAHARTKVILRETGPHYGEVRCAVCNKFMGWAPRPRDLEHDLNGGQMLGCPDCDGEVFAVMIGPTGYPSVVCGECGRHVTGMAPATAEKFLQHARARQ